jgi:hypothetical protein
MKKPENDGVWWGRVFRSMNYKPMKVKIEERNGTKYLYFQPEGMKVMSVPVITSGSRDKTNAWTWNGDLEKPTIKPSVLHTYSKSYDVGEYKEIKIHFWLNDGVCKCLSDCTDGNANKTLELIPVK